MAKKIKVLIAEDHAIVRQGLKILIRADPDMEVSGEAADGRQALQMAEKTQPDVVVMDVAMPLMNGLEATRKIVRQQPRSKVLVLSSYSDDESVQQLVQAGASGYLTKHSASTDLLEAIRQVNRGHSYFSPMIAQRLRSQLRVKAGLAQQKNDLTPRERQVLTLIAEGLASKQIAARLKVSSKTVEKHRQQVMDKLNIHEIAGLTRYAASKQLVCPVNPTNNSGPPSLSAPA
jgi:DNA-binding NarL/FixJ family response regulator